MSPWEFLGIEPTQDERAIKRAYSKLLLVHRPDGDQATFERLRQAYEFALQLARNKRKVAAPRVVFAGQQSRPLVPLPVAPPPAPSPAVDESREQLRPYVTVADELIESAAHLRDDPAAFRALLASVPELFNLDTKLAVSAVFAQRIAKGLSFPSGLTNVLSTFFEWDTFAEQRRLTMMGVQVAILQTLLAVAELQRYLEAAPARGDRDTARNWLKILRYFRSTPARWALGIIHGPWRNKIRQALEVGVGRFGWPALEEFLGRSSAHYWRRLYSTTPTLTQGATYLARILLLAVTGSISAALVGRPFGADNPWIILLAFAAWAGTIAFMWRYLGWFLRAASYALSKVIWPYTMERIEKLGLISRTRTLLGVMAALAIIGWFWPAGIPSILFAALAIPFVLVTVPDHNAFIAFFVLLIASAIGVARWSGNGSLILIVWPLSSLYLQCSSQWLFRWIKRRWNRSWPTASGYLIVGALLAFICLIAVAGATSH